MLYKPRNFSQIIVINAISADSIATSLPMAPMAIPNEAVVLAGASR